MIIMELDVMPSVDKYGLKIHIITFLCVCVPACITSIDTLWLNKYDGFKEGPSTPSTLHCWREIYINTILCQKHNGNSRKAITIKGPFGF